MPGYNRAGEWLIVGSGVAGPMRLVTSGQYIGRQKAGFSFEVLWNMGGALAAQDNSITSLKQPSSVAGGGGTTSPLFGGAPAGVFVIEGSMDDVWYTDMGVTVSSLFGVSTSGQRLINVNGALPDWVRLRYENTSSSGVFNVKFSSGGYGGG